MAEIIDINGPNREWGKHHVEVVLKQWRNSKTYMREVGGNCLGLDVIRSAVEDVIEEILMAGTLTLTDPDGEEMEFDEGSCLDDRELERMVVSARIISYTPPTLNEVRARNGADPVEDGNLPVDYDAEAVEREAARRREGQAAS